MAEWGKIGSRGNVEDRRANSIGIGGGALGIGGVILYLLLNYLGGGHLTDVINQLDQVQVPTQQQYQNSDFEGADNYEVFVSTVLGSTNEMWSKIFSQNNLTYNPPKLVLFRQATRGACGVSTSYIGPHYCPLDQTIYLDETFFQELQNKFKAKGGDVAEAYVIAHEVGHHAQNELGILDEIEQQKTSANENELSVKQELQADCFAGLWAYSIKNLGVFEENEIQEALDAAAAIGDDRIQSRTEGYVNSETWTHGSSEQRVGWFTTGFNSGALNQCNTFE
ncbi:MAG TPA: neutral zinc metallopeptidase [Verrucomicrobiae bacterium]|nr:neutral zinc metallopeptidase [Verrucomicrobiae bacterium]